MPSNYDDYESSLIISLGETLFNLMALNVLWVLCTLPLVTIGASTTALNYTCIKLRNDEGESLVKMFFHSLKENFRQALFLGTGMLALLIIIMAGMIQAVGNVNAGIKGGKLLLVASFVGLFIWFMVFAFIFMVQARFDNPIKGTLKSAFYLILTHFDYAIKIASIEIMLLFFIPLFLWMYFPYGFPMVMFIGVPLTAYILAKNFNRIFKPYIPEEKNK